MFQKISFRELTSLFTALSAGSLVACGAASGEPANSPVDAQEVPAAAAPEPAALPEASAVEAAPEEATPAADTPALAAPEAVTPAESTAAPIEPPKPAKASGPKASCGSKHNKAAGAKGGCGAGTCGKN